MTTNPKVLVLPDMHKWDELRPIESYNPRTYGYYFDKSSDVINLLEVNNRFPNLREWKAFHVFVQENNRVYHIVRFAPKQHEGTHYLTLKLGNSFVANKVPDILGTGEYQYRNLSDFGLAQIRPDMLIALDEATVGTN